MLFVDVPLTVLKFNYLHSNAIQRDIERYRETLGGRKDVLEFLHQHHVAWTMYGRIIEEIPSKTYLNTYYREVELLIRMVDPEAATLFRMIW